MGAPAGPRLHDWPASLLQGRPGPWFAIALWPFWSPFVVTPCWWCRNTRLCGPKDSRVCQALMGRVRVVGQDSAQGLHGGGFV